MLCSVIMSTVFDRVWHKGLVHILQNDGITGNVLNWTNDYISNGKQQIDLIRSTTRLSFRTIVILN